MWFWWTLDPKTWKGSYFHASLIKYSSLSVQCRCWSMCPPLPQQKPYVCRYGFIFYAIRSHIISTDCPSTLDFMSKWKWLFHARTEVKPKQETGNRIMKMSGTTLFSKIVEMSADNADINSNTHSCRAMMFPDRPITLFVSWAAARWSLLRLLLQYSVPV